MAPEREPITERPHMRNYGVPATEEGLLPWSWAVERLTAGHNYWVATTRPDGAPHVAPVWGVWLDDLFVFSTATSSRKARNIAADARCVICPERGDEAVILEGVAEEVTDRAILARFKDAYDPKYQWDMDPTKGGVYAVTPRSAFGFIEHANQFATTATRWRFD